MSKFSNPHRDSAVLWSAALVLVAVIGAVGSLASEALATSNKHVPARAMPRSGHAAMPQVASIPAAGVNALGDLSPGSVQFSSEPAPESIATF